MKTISIPVVFNDETKGTVVLGAKTYLSSSMPSKLFYDIEKGYMHIDESREEEFYGKEWQPTKEEYIRAVKELTINYFAGKLEIENPFFELKNMYINRKFRSIKAIASDILFEYNFFTEKRSLKISLRGIKYFQYTQIEVAQKTKCPRLGGTWQKYFQDKNWITEAEKIKGETIYLA